MSYSYYAECFYGIVPVAAVRDLKLDIDISAFAEIDEIHPQSRRPEVIRVAEVLAQFQVHAGRAGNSLSGVTVGTLYIPESLSRTESSTYVLTGEYCPAWRRRLEGVLGALDMAALVPKIGWQIAAGYW